MILDMFIILGIILVTICVCTAIGYGFIECAEIKEGMDDAKMAE